MGPKFHFKKPNAQDMEIKFAQLHREKNWDRDFTLRDREPQEI